MLCWLLNGFCSVCLCLLVFGLSNCFSRFVMFLVFTHSYCVPYCFLVLPCCVVLLLSCCFLWPMVFLVCPIVILFLLLCLVLYWCLVFKCVKFSCDYDSSLCLLVFVGV